MHVRNAEIAEMFREVADLLEIEGANRFRVRAYRQASSTIDDLSGNVSEMVEAGEDLTALPGIGDDLAEAIREITETGSFQDLEALRDRTTPSMRDLMTVPGLGPHRLRKLRDALGVRNLDELEMALEQGRVRTVEGFGEKTEENLRRALKTGRRKKERRLRASVEGIAEALGEFVVSLDGVDQACVAGSYRRKRETVGDLDLVASSNDPAGVIDRFVEYEEIYQVVSHGDTRASVLHRSNLAVDLRVIKPESYGAALIYFTGSREHQLILRRMAIDHDWKLNEYGLFDSNGKRLAGETEAEIYTAFDLDYIEPELRENRGEIDAAASGELPQLITLDDIRGDLHVHSNWTDGRASIEEMARAAIDLGYEYLAITDHSRHMRMVNGLDTDDLQRQAREIDALNEGLEEITLLKGIEVDILKDGSLDLPDDVLAALDIVVCSIHSAFNLSEDDQTARLIRAIEHPHCQIIGHPTGRKLLERDPISLDLDRVLDAARETGCALELNADPHRLDLDDATSRSARDAGVKIVLSSDAHSQAGLVNMRHGLWQARRGWLETSDILNSRSLTGLRSNLKQNS